MNQVDQADQVDQVDQVDQMDQVDQAVQAEELLPQTGSRGLGSTVGSVCKRGLWCL